MAGVDPIQHDRDGHNIVTLPLCFCALRAPPLIWINANLFRRTRTHFSDPSHLTPISVACRTVV